MSHPDRIVFEPLEDEQLPAFAAALEALNAVEIRSPGNYGDSRYVTPEGTTIRIFEKTVRGRIAYVYPAMGHGDAVVAAFEGV